MTDQFSSSSPSIVTRAINIVTKPKLEWDVIRGEVASIQSLFTGYAMILAAIPAVFSFLGAILMSRIPIVPALVASIFAYVMTLAMTFVIGLIIEALAPSFGAVKDRTQAMKVAVYAMTPTWLAGVLSIVPLLGLLILIASLYGLYLLYLGLKQVVGAPEDKVIVYTLCIIGCAIVISLIIAAINMSVVGGLIAGSMAVGAY